MYLYICFLFCHPPFTLINQLLNFPVILCCKCVLPGQFPCSVSQSVICNFIALFTAHSVRDSCVQIPSFCATVLIRNGMRVLRAREGGSERECEGAREQSTRLRLQLDLGISANTFGSYGFIYVLHSSMSALSHSHCKWGRVKTTRIKWHLYAIFSSFCALALLACFALTLFHCHHKHFVYGFSERFSN